MAVKRRTVLAGGAALAAGLAVPSKAALLTGMVGRSGNSGSGEITTTWRLINVDGSSTPFGNATIGGAKHVAAVFFPEDDRVHTFGGDYSATPQNFGFVGENGQFTTNDPVAANTYDDRLSSLCNDQFRCNPSVDPMPWERDHPYLPQNLSGTREARPGRPDQGGFEYDESNNDLIAFLHCTRESGFPYRQAGIPDLWANGDMSVTAPLSEPTATWKFTPPSGSGTTGTWEILTTSRLLYRMGAGTFYDGNVLVSDIGSERIGKMTRDSTNNAFACSSSTGGDATLAIFSFHRNNDDSTTATKKYQYRTRSLTGYDRVFTSMSYCEAVGGFLYFVGTLRTNGGTRTSALFKVDLTATFAISNTGTIPADAIEIFTLPWSLSIPGVRFDQGGAGSSGRVRGNEVITGQTSGATAIISTLNLNDDTRFVDLTHAQISDSDWTSGVASGYTGLREIAGTFQSGENVTSPNGQMRLTTAVVDGVYESVGNGSNNWPEHCGVVEVDGRIVVLCSYDGIIQNGVVKGAVFDPATEEFTAISNPGENLVANCWCSLPNSSEAMLMHNTARTPAGNVGYSNLRNWALEVNVA